MASFSLLSGSFAVSHGYSDPVFKRVLHVTHDTLPPVVAAQVSSDTVANPRSQTPSEHSSAFSSASSSASSISSATTSASSTSSVSAKMGQIPSRRIQNHITAMETAGYKVDPALTAKVHQSLTNLNMVSDEEGPLLCIMPVPLDILGPEPLKKTQSQQQQMHLGVPRPKYFINCFNGAHIVLPALSRLDWSRVVDRRDIVQCCFRWTETVNQINYQTFREFEQMVNHIPNCGHFTNKLGLLMSLRSYAREARANGRSDADTSFIPETYWLDDPRERHDFLGKLSDKQMWILKPCGLNQGKGIYLIRSRSEFIKLDDARQDETRRGRIVQRYITSPLLLDDRKFDIRCYLMIVSTMPYLVLFAPGYIRLSLRKYSLSDTNLITHLTNQFIQKKDPSYDKSKEDSVWTFRKLNDYINTKVAPSKHLTQNWVIRQMLPEMHRITMHVFNAVKDKLACRTGFFEIYGMDFMIDENMKLWLIEINSNPAMNTNCEVLRRVIPPIVTRFIQISIECFEKARRWQPLLPIMGIAPRDANNIEAHRDSPNWIVSLRSSPRSTANSGLPAAFKILYHENLSAAKTRQARSYSIPLRLWVPPRVHVAMPIPKPGLVVKHTSSRASHVSSSSVPRLPSLKSIRGSSLPAPTSGRLSPTGSSTSQGSTHLPRIQPNRMFRSSSAGMARLHTSRSDSSRNSSERRTHSASSTQDSLGKATRPKTVAGRNGSSILANVESDELPQLQDVDSSIDANVSNMLWDDESVSETSNNSNEEKTSKKFVASKESDRNDSCSVRIPPMVSEFVQFSAPNLILPPLPPIILASAILNEIPEGETDQDATNNGNELREE